MTIFKIYRLYKTRNFPHILCDVAVGSWFSCDVAVGLVFILVTTYKISENEINSFNVYLFCHLVKVRTT